VTRRRTFLLATGVCLVGMVRPRASHAQTAARPHKVGIVALGTGSGNAADVQAFRERLVQLGYVEGRNLVLESRFANGRSEALPALVADLVRLQMDVLVTITTPAAQAAKAATATIPIVMAGSANPVGLGLVASLSHPGANVTGVTNNPGQGFVLKQLQLLKEAAPKISRVAIIKSNHPIEDAALGAMELAGPQLGVVPVAVVFDASTWSEVRLLLTQARPDALYVFPNSINDLHAGAIAAFAAENRLPTIYGGRNGVDAGGLLSYGVNWLDLRRHAAVYVDKILKGAKPADLPVEGPVKFEMVVNLKTAKALGIAIPQSVLLQATEVIE
jgi:putative tryptophan/tyrosine transport system substrate-binding protein